ncbi:MAG: hypothetical protein JOZ65_13570 [Chloroflexi bacterium]|nr:hypothetical protein [Chloroflexota bacterium]
MAGSSPPTGASTREELVRLAASQTPLPSPVEAYIEHLKSAAQYGLAFRGADARPPRAELVERAHIREQLYSSQPPASCHNSGLAWSV